MIIQQTQPAQGQIIQKPFEPFYSDEFRGWYWRDDQAGIHGPYGSDEICRHAMNEIITQAEKEQNHVA